MQVTKRTKGNWLELRAARKIERTISRTDAYNQFQPY